MAVVQNPLIGRTKQSVASTTFSKWKGRNTLRAKPLTVAQPNTEPQQAQKSKMSQAVAIGQFIFVAILLGWNEFKATNSQWALYIKHTLKFAFSVSGAVATFIPNMFRISSGSLVGFDSLGVAPAGTSTATITWNDNTGVGNASASDKLFYVAYNVDANTWQFHDTSATRADETFTTGALGTAGDDVWIYPFFTNQFSTLECDSPTGQMITLT